MLRFMAVFLYKNKSSNTIGILVDTDGAAAGPWCDAGLEPRLQPVSKPNHSVQNQIKLNYLTQTEPAHKLAACSVSWFTSLLVREQVLLIDLCERKILFQLKIYDRLQQATAKRT